MELDEQLFLAVNAAFCSDAASAFAAVATRLGNGWVLAALVVPAMLLLDRRRAREHLLAMALSVAAGGAIVAAAKVAVDRPRPAVSPALAGEAIHTPLGTPSDRSFPSGHAQTAAGTATYLSCLYPALAPLFAALAALVALSRVALGVHFPADVLAGAAVGAAVAYAGYRLARRRARARAARSPESSGGGGTPR